MTCNSVKFQRASPTFTQLDVYERWGGRQIDVGHR